MHFILSIQVTSKLYSSKFIWDVTNNMDIIRKYVECASFWCEFHHHCLFCLGDMGDRNLPRFTSFIIIVNFKAGLLQIYMACYLCTFNVAAIFFRGHPYIWRTTVRHDKILRPVQLLSCRNVGRAWYIMSHDHDQELAVKQFIRQIHPRSDIVCLLYTSPSPRD